MNILITGSSGFVGSHLFSFLNSKGHLVVGHTRNSNTRKLGTIICNFLESTPAVHELKNFDAVIHLVGKVHDVEGVGLESEYETLNHSSVIAFAKNCSEAKVKKFIFFSTIKTLDINIKRNDNLEGIYSITKKKAEDSLLNFSKDTDMEINIIRPSLIYGQGVKGNLRTLIRLIKLGLCPPFPETNNRKYLIHIRDLSEIVESVLGSSLDTKDIITATEIKPYSTRRVLQDLRQALGKGYTTATFPYGLIRFLMHAPLGIGFKLRKLFGDDQYEISNRGFKPRTKLTLKNIFDDNRNT
mgnify:CR=1 FL=1|tara:strand:+ start:44861 stop:45754 length:894 start_codon:yes stop_codon:yes gene_type:complete